MSSITFKIIFIPKQFCLFYEISQNIEKIMFFVFSGWVLFCIFENWLFSKDPIRIRSTKYFCGINHNNFLLYCRCFNFQNIYSPFCDSSKMFFVTKNERVNNVKRKFSFFFDDIDNCSSWYFFNEKLQVELLYYFVSKWIIFLPGIMLVENYVLFFFHF